MGSEQDNIHVSERLAQIEEIIGRHYRVYAGKYQTETEFWNSLADEEESHAQLIRQLYRMASVRFDEKRFDVESIIEYQKHLEDMLVYMQQAEKSLREALEDSIKIESTVLERKFFEAFKAVLPDAKEMIAQIRDDTQRHKSSLEELLSKC